MKKRATKRRKLDAEKVFALIGKITTLLLFLAMWTGILVFGFLQNTIY